MRCSLSSMALTTLESIDSAGRWWGGCLGRFVPWSPSWTSLSSLVSSVWLQCSGDPGAHPRCAAGKINDTSRRWSAAAPL